MGLSAIGCRDEKNDRKPTSFLFDTPSVEKKSIATVRDTDIQPIHQSSSYLSIEAMLQEEAKPVDVEAGTDEGGPQFDPNNKTCYEPVLERVQPVLEKVQPVVDRVKPAVAHTAEKVSEFFDDDENEEMTEETVT